MAQTEKKGMMKRHRIIAWGVGLGVFLFVGFLYITNFSPLSITRPVPQGEAFTVQLGETVRLKGSMLFITLEGLRAGTYDPNILGLTGGDSVSYSARHWGRSYLGQCIAGSGCTPRVSSAFPFNITLQGSDYSTSASFVVQNQRRFISSEEEKCEAFGDLTREQAFCYRSLVTNFSDPSYCKKIYHDEWKDSCMSAAANALSDDAYCKKIKDELLKKECLARSQGTSVPCDAYEGLQRDNCLLDELRNNATHETCEMIVNERHRDTCWHIVAKEIKDAQYCEKIIGVDRADFCWVDASAFEDGNAAEYCAKIVERDTGGCWTNAAKQTGDAQYCESVPSDHTYNRVCWTAVAEAQQDVALCENISAEYFYNVCMDLVWRISATEQIDIDLCDNIVYGDYADTGREWCRWEVMARENNDPSFCDKISHENRVRSCKASLGQESGISN